MITVLSIKIDPFACDMYTFVLFLATLTFTSRKTAQMLLIIFTGKKNNNNNNNNSSFILKSA